MSHDPLWEIVFKGPITDWVARPGRNEDADGVPRPFRAPHHASVLVRAPTRKAAVDLAIVSNPEYAGFKATARQRK